MTRHRKSFVAKPCDRCAAPILVGDLYWLDRFKDKRPNGHYVERVCDECHEKQRDDARAEMVERQRAQAERDAARAEVERLGSAIAMLNLGTSLALAGLAATLVTVDDTAVERADYWARRAGIDITTAEKTTS